MIKCFIKEMKAFCSMLTPSEDVPAECFCPPGFLRRSGFLRKFMGLTEPVWDDFSIVFGSKNIICWIGFKGFRVWGDHNNLPRTTIPPPPPSPLFTPGRSVHGLIPDHHASIPLWSSAPDQTTFFRITLTCCVCVEMLFSSARLPRGVAWDPAVSVEIAPPIMMFHGNVKWSSRPVSACFLSFCL